jgi:hypothetical protein
MYRRQVRRLSPQAGQISFFWRPAGTKRPGSWGQKGRQQFVKKSDFKKVFVDRSTIQNGRLFFDMALSLFFRRLGMSTIRQKLIF